MTKLDYFHKIPLKEIYSDQNFNCRSEITTDSIIMLAQSIEINGLQSPIIVQKRDKLPDGCLYRIIAGHRRYAACEHLKYESIEAKIIEDINEQHAKILNLSENIDRKNLTPYEEAMALAKIFPDYISLRKMSKIINRSVEWCRRRRELINYPPDIQLAFHKKLLGIRDLVALSSLDPKHKVEAARKLLEARQRGEVIPMGTVSQRAPHRGTKEIQQMIGYFLGRNITSLPVKVLSWVLGYTATEDIEKLTEEAEVDFMKALYANN